MNKGLMSKFKEALFSVLPVTVIVLALSFTPLIDVTVGEAATFGVSALLLIVGIGLFNLGSDLAMTYGRTRRSWSY